MKTCLARAPKDSDPDTLYFKITTSSAVFETLSRIDSFFLKFYIAVSCPDSKKGGFGKMSGTLLDSPLTRYYYHDQSTMMKVREFPNKYFEVSRQDESSECCFKLM